MRLSRKFYHPAGVALPPGESSRNQYGTSTHENGHRGENQTTRLTRSMSGVQNFDAQRRGVRGSACSWSTVHPVVLLKKRQAQGLASSQIHIPVHLPTNRLTLNLGATVLSFPCFQPRDNGYGRSTAVFLLRWRGRHSCDMSTSMPTRPSCTHSLFLFLSTT